MSMLAVINILRPQKFVYNTTWLVWRFTDAWHFGVIVCRYKWRPTPDAINLLHSWINNNNNNNNLFVQRIYIRRYRGAWNCWWRMTKARYWSKIEIFAQIMGNIARTFGMENLNSRPNRGWKKFEDMTTLFDTIHEPDRQTDSQTPHNGIGHAYA